MPHRSIRINGATTSIALEPAFWLEVERRSQQQGVSWQVYLRQLLEQYGDVKNRAASIKEDLLIQINNERMALLGNEQTWRIYSTKQEFEITTHVNRVLVGRDNNNDIVINDKQVSRQHIALINDNKAWWVLDLNSKNGTNINGDHVSSKKMNKNDVITIGDTTISLV